MRVLILLFYMTAGHWAFASSAEPKAINCGGFLSASPTLNRAAREMMSSNLSPLSQQALLPKAMVLVNNDILSDSDVEAITLSLKNQSKEATFYEGLDRQGNVVAKSDVVVGEDRAVSSGDLFISFLQQLDKKGFDRSMNPIAKIRSSHTHPAGSGSHKFSFGDTNSLFVEHAVLEATGGNEIELEESILYLDINLTDALKVMTENSINRLPYSKKTLRIPGQSLSLVRGDYSIGKSLDAKVRKAILQRPEKPTYSKANW